MSLQVTRLEHQDLWTEEQTLWDNWHCTFLHTWLQTGQVHSMFHCIFWYSVHQALSFGHLQLWKNLEGPQVNSITWVFWCWRFGCEFWFCRYIPTRRDWKLVWYVLISNESDILRCFNRQRYQSRNNRQTYLVPEFLGYVIFLVPMTTRFEIQIFKSLWRLFLTRISLPSPKVDAQLSLASAQEGTARSKQQIVTSSRALALLRSQSSDPETRLRWEQAVFP